MELAVLGSGSKGNAVVLKSPSRCVLIDAGLSAKQIELRMKLLGLALSDLDAVFLTHEHQDHCGGLRVLMRKLAIPIYANAMTKEVVAERFQGDERWVLFESGHRFGFEEWEVESVSVPHDAVDPVSFIFKTEHGQVGVVTDLGYITPVLEKALEGTQILFIEANYDPLLLEQDMKRPWSIKQRISSKHGHLSNGQCAQLISYLQESGLEKVIIGHLSSDCNHHDRIYEELAASMQRGLEVVIAEQGSPTPWVSIRPSAVESVQDLGQAQFLF